MVGEPEPDAQVPQAGRSVSVVRTIHVKLDSGDILMLQRHLPEMRLDDAVRHILDVWMDDRMGPPPDFSDPDMVAIPTELVVPFLMQMSREPDPSKEDADDAGTDG